MAALVVGCTAGTTAGGGNTQPTDAASEVGSLDALALPLESLLMLGADTKAVLDSAVDTLTDQCMSQLGFDYIPYPLAPPRSILSVGIRYGYLSAEDASATGYATSYPPTEDPAYLDAVAAVDARRQALGPSYESALYGSEDSAATTGDTRGCYPAAQESVYGARGGIYNLPAYRALLDLQSQSSDELYASESARDVIDQWSECMSEAGYNFREWWEAREAFGQTKSATDDERQQASTDATCRRQVSLERTLFDLEVQIMNRLINENPDLVRSYNIQMEQSLDKARDLTGQNE